MINLSGIYMIENINIFNYHVGMKKWFLILIMIFVVMAPVFAEDKKPAEKNNTDLKETYKINVKIEYDDNEVETIYLDDNIDKPQVNIRQRSMTLPVGVLNITSNNDSPRSALSRAMAYRGGLTDILPFSGSVAEQMGGFSYGQTWGQELSYAQMEDTTSFFIRYDFPKWFSVTGSIRQSVNQDIGNQYNILRIIPEWRITDRLTLKDSFSSYMNLPKNKNELTLVYTPELKKYADSLMFELGLAQSYYRSGKQSSAVRFATGFKL